MIPHSRPWLEEKDVKAAAHVLQTGHVAQGPYVERFERSLAAWVGVSGGVAVSSGTAALELALRALGVESGDEVIMPSYVCAAPWLAAVRVGAQPRVADIELETYGIDPAKAEKALTSKTRAIIVPHLFGLPADVTRLAALGVPIIEDCAQTLGATVDNRQVGTLGTAAVCSFYATKLLCTGEGGMVLSDDETILERARALREYDEEPTLEAASFNHKMTDLQAALGVSQLERFQAFLTRRSAIAARYRDVLHKLDVVLPGIPKGSTHIYYRYVIRVPAWRRNRGALGDALARLEHRGVQCRRPIFRALHRYLQLDGFPQCEEASETAISIPLYPSMTDEEIDQTAHVVLEELGSLT